MKSQSFPESIPTAFAENDVLSNAYRSGWNHGHGVACHNVPTLGDKIFSDSLGRITVDAENIREVHESECWSAQENARQFSPFEFIAHELNSLDDEPEDGEEENTVSSDDAWEAFEQGITDAIQADLATYTDEDYGIEEEDGEEGEDEEDSETAEGIKAYLAMHPEIRAEKLEEVENGGLRLLVNALGIDLADHEWNDRRNVEQAILGAMVGLAGE